MAQANITGSLSGTVTDKTGAAIASSNAVLTNKETAVTYKGTTDGRGDYRFPSVVPGTYVLVVDAPGYLIYLSPSVTRAAGGEGQGSGVVAAGTRATNNNYLIDGADNNDPVVPSGAVINVVTKGGTNQVHGTFFEFIRNPKYKAYRLPDRPMKSTPKSLSANTLRNRVWGRMLR